MGGKSPNTEMDRKEELIPLSKSELKKYFKMLLGYLEEKGGVDPDQTLIDAALNEFPDLVQE